MDGNHLAAGDFGYDDVAIRRHREKTGAFNPAGYHRNVKSCWDAEGKGHALVLRGCGGGQGKAYRLQQDRGKDETVLSNDHRKK